MAAEGLLKRMVDERRARNAGAIARTVQYNAVMKSWATSGEARAGAMRVEQILRNMQEMYAPGDGDVQPNLESFQIAHAMAFNRMSEAVSEDTFVELTGGMSYANFPAAWKLPAKMQSRKKRYQNKEAGGGKVFSKRCNMRP